MRSFIATDFDDEIKKRLGDLQSRLKPRLPGLKWTRPEQLHVTLKFLGEIADRQIVPISQALDALAAGCEPFDVTIAGLGAFPPAGRVNVIWVGIDDVENRLAHCQSRCEELIGPLGFPPENRRFSPHLTLARNNNPRISREIREALSSLGSPSLGVQCIDHLTLYQSTLGKGGATYQALSRHHFRAPAPPAP